MFPRLCARASCKVGSPKPPSPLPTTHQFDLSFSAQGLEGLLVDQLAGEHWPEGHSDQAPLWEERFMLSDMLGS